MDAQESSPLFLSQVSCGFPSPADEYLDASLDLNQFLIKKPAATFLVRASGDSMIDAGIFHSDILIVDRSLTAQFGQIVVAIYNGEFTVKRYMRAQPQGIMLAPENKKYQPLIIHDMSEFQVWGVVTYCLHSLNKV